MKAVQYNMFSSHLSITFVYHLSKYDIHVHEWHGDVNNIIMLKNKKM